jgi:hypothetical protein
MIKGLQKASCEFTEIYLFQPTHRPKVGMTRKSGTAPKQLPRNELGRKTPCFAAFGNKLNPNYGTEG